MDLSLRQKVAVVTGASAGIGHGVCEVLAAEGVHVIAVARRGDRLAALAERIAARGHPCPLAIEADLLQETAPGLVATRALEQFQRIDIVVNNAGGSLPLPADPATADDDGERTWREAFALQFDAVRRLTEQALPHMIAQQWGRVVNTGGTLEPPDRVNGSTVAKAAVVAWAKGLSHELGQHGITVNTVVPGRIMSEQILRLHPSVADRATYAAQHIPLGRFGDPADIGNLVAFLCSPRADYITGTVLHVDGGLRRHAF